MEFLSFLAGIGLLLILKYVISGFYIVNQNERAVKTVFGKARWENDT